MEKITKEKALEAIEKIKQVKGDPEEAHWKEDALYVDFISCVSNGLYSKKEAIEVASIILKSSEIDFPRWYA